MYTAQNGRKYTLPTYFEALVISSMTVPVKIVSQRHLKVNQFVQNVAALVTYVDVGDVLKWPTVVMSTRKHIGKKSIASNVAPTKLFKEIQKLLVDMLLPPGEYLILQEFRSMQ